MTQSPYQIITMTPQQLEDFAMVCFQKAQHMPKKNEIEPTYKITNPIIKETFPNLAISTLKQWCMRGILGKMGTDGKYYVTLSQIQKTLFK